MKTLLNLFFLIFLSIHISAQENVISGKVVDQQTGEPLTGARVKHISSGRQVMTDFDGQFRLPVGVTGITEISVSYVSYKDVKLNRVDAGDAIPVELNIKMRREGSGNNSNGLATARRVNLPTS